MANLTNFGSQNNENDINTLSNKVTTLESNVSALNNDLSQKTPFTNGTIVVQVGLTNGEMYSFTVPEDGWYFVRAINVENSGSCSAYMLNKYGYISADTAPSDNYQRATTGLIPLKKNSVITCRALFTDSGAICRLI